MHYIPKSSASGLYTTFNPFYTLADRLVSLSGKFALRWIWQVMQHHSLPPIHPDPSYHIPVTWPTTPPPAPRAIDTQCQPPPLTFMELEDISSDGKLGVCTGLLLKNDNTHCFENAGISCPSRYNPSYCGFSLYLWHVHANNFHIYSKSLKV